MSLSYTLQFAYLHSGEFCIILSHNLIFQKSVQGLIPVFINFGGELIYPISESISTTVLGWLSK